MKRIITVQDISCVGKCSLTVASPIISAMGVEACVLPTAILSTHTAFSKFTFLDLTSELENITNTIKELGITFDGLYTGYLGSITQLQFVNGLIDEYKKNNAFVLIAPVMADDGVLYKGFTMDFAKQMANLCKRADLIIPNLTEATFMLGEEYNENYDEEYVKGILLKLADMGAKRVAISGVTFNDSQMGVYFYDGTTGEFFSYFNEKLPVKYHGTGDIFASTAFGAIMRGLSFEKALTLAVDYTLECMKCTCRDSERRFYGVNFEEALPMLVKRINE